MHNQKKYSPLKKFSKPFIPPQTDGMIRFSFKFGCSESTVKKQTCQIKMLYREQTSAPRALHSARTPATTLATNKHSQHTEMPAMSPR